MVRPPPGLPVFPGVPILRVKLFFGAFFVLVPWWMGHPPSPFRPALPRGGGVTEGIRCPQQWPTAPVVPRPLGGAVSWGPAGASDRSPDPGLATMAGGGGVAVVGLGHERWTPPVAQWPGFAPGILLVALGSKTFPSMPMVTVGACPPPVHFGNGTAEGGPMLMAKPTPILFDEVARNRPPKKPEPKPDVGFTIL